MTKQYDDRRSRPSRELLRRCAEAAHEIGRAQLAFCNGAERLNIPDNPDLWSAGPRQSRAIATAYAALAGNALWQDFAQIGAAHREALTALAQPPEILLALGADSRARPIRSVNSYGMPLSDRSPRLPASSCTATPPDAIVLADIDTWRSTVLRRIFDTGDVPSPRELRDQVCNSLADRLGVAEEFRSRIALTPSGTDALLLLSVLVLGTASGRAVTIVMVGAREAGRGVLNAVRGLRFDSYPPMGGECQLGTPLSGLDSARLCVRDVQIRDHHGWVRPVEAVRAEIEDLIAQEHVAGAEVLVHLMESSKTGIRAAEPSWVRQWLIHWPRRLHIAIDAAQYRTDRARLLGYLAAGASVVITGSKALSAPPFCGAVLLSSALMEAAGEITAVPTGLADYLSAADLPERFTTATTGLVPVNLGLIARWRAALTEWKKVDALSPSLRSTLSANLVDGWRRALSKLPGVEIMPTASKTVVNFVLYGLRGPFSLAETEAAYDQITSEGGIYIGQPVELTPGGAVALRLAVGAATLTRLSAGQYTDEELIALAVDRVSRCTSIVERRRK